GGHGARGGPWSSSPIGSPPGRPGGCVRPFGHTQRYTPGGYSALRCSVSGCSVSGRPVLVLSVSGEFPAQRRMDPGARLVQADDLDGLPAARVLRLDGVQGGDGRGVPDVRGGKVDRKSVG